MINIYKITIHHNRREREREREIFGGKRNTHIPSLNEQHYSEHELFSRNRFSLKAHAQNAILRRNCVSTVFFYSQLSSTQLEPC